MKSRRTFLKETLALCLFAFVSAYGFLYILYDKLNALSSKPFVNVNVKKNVDFIACVNPKRLGRI